MDEQIIHLDSTIDNISRRVDKIHMLLDQEFQHHITRIIDDLRIFCKIENHNKTQKICRHMNHLDKTLQKRAISLQDLMRSCSLNPDGEIYCSGYVDVQKPRNNNARSENLRPNAPEAVRSEYDFLSNTNGSPDHGNNQNKSHLIDKQLIDELLEFGQRKSPKKANRPNGADGKTNKNHP